MDFTTQVPIKKSNNPISYQSRILSLGSCFAVNIAEKFDYFKFNSIANPFGILFHPIALENFLRFSVEGKTFGDADVFSNNDVWHSFDAHSDLSASNKEELLENLTRACQNTRKFLEHASHVIITLGTAWAYHNRASDKLVANCHKIPQREFDKDLLSVDRIAESLKNSIELLQKANPEINIIFTVSPVRHIKDGMVENQWSKANLISALHQTRSHFSDTTYFPSYEIMMDELRDYRFYAADMIHPSQIAINYIWERFSTAFISPDASPIMDEVSYIRKARQHKPFNPLSPQHLTFVGTLNNRIENLQANHNISF